MSIIKDLTVGRCAGSEVFMSVHIIFWHTGSGTGAVSCRSFTEDLREIRLRRKADAGGYLSYRQIGGHQKLLAGFQPPVCQVIDRRLSDTFGKGVCQIEFVDMCDLRQGIQCNVLGIVGIDITLRQSTFLGQLEGGVRDDGQILLPGNIYQKHLEQSVAHLFKAGKFVAEFLHHQLGEVDELFLSEP